MKGARGRRQLEFQLVMGMHAEAPREIAVAGAQPIAAHILVEPRESPGVREDGPMPARGGFDGAERHFLGPEKGARPDFAMRDGQQVERPGRLQQLIPAVGVVAAHRGDVLIDNLIGSGADSGARTAGSASAQGTTGSAQAIIPPPIGAVSDSSTGGIETGPGANAYSPNATASCTPGSKG